MDGGCQRPPHDSGLNHLFDVALYALRRLGAGSVAPQDVADRTAVAPIWCRRVALRNPQHDVIGLAPGRCERNRQRLNGQREHGFAQRPV